MAFELPSVRTDGLALTAVMVAALIGGTVHASSVTPDTTSAPRVRSSDAYIRAMIDEAGRRSATFRRLVDLISATNGIVYVEQGECGHSVHACLALSVTAAAEYRILRILVDARRPDWEVMASIGHELQHAVEVLDNPTITTSQAIYFFYALASPTTGAAFETAGAIKAGNAVRNEVGSYARR